MAINVLSCRAYEKWASWHIVYEWEDEFCKCNDFVLKARKETGILLLRRVKNLLVKCFPRYRACYSYRRDREINLMWIMNARTYRTYPVKNVIPIYLDFPSNMVRVIKNATKKLPCYFVTNKNIFDMLVEMGDKKVKYMPLSIADKYIDLNKPTDKSIDVLQLGRRNGILHEYMIQYCKEHPGVEYVYQTGDGTLGYESTIRGTLGEFDTRKAYIGLLSSAKVSLVSSPGIDKSRDFGGVDFFTPRFYESAALDCYMIGRYSENEECRLINIASICPNVKSQKEFDYYLEFALSGKSDKWEDKRKAFLAQNVTSKRAEYVLEQINRAVETLNHQSNSLR